jgi:hypothetical protein
LRQRTGDTDTLLLAAAQPIGALQRLVQQADTLKAFEGDAPLREW